MIAHVVGLLRAVILLVLLLLLFRRALVVLLRLALAGRFVLGKALILRIQDLWHVVRLLIALGHSEAR